MTTLLFKAGVIVIYLCLNIGLNMLNKWMLAIYGFKFPLFVTLCHQGFSFVALLPVMFASGFRETHVSSIRSGWRGLLAVGLFFAVNVSFNNLSLLTISLSLNQVIRASIPIVAAIGSVFVEQKRITSQEFISLTILASGVALAVYDGSHIQGSLVGIIVCLTGTVSNGLMMTFSGRMMSERIDVFRLTFYTSPVVLLTLIPFYYALEHKKLLEYNKPGYYVPVVISCFLALGYNMVHYWTIKITSSVTTTVLGEMKIVMILILSSMFLGELKIWSANMLLGCVAALLGFGMYSHIKLSRMPLPEMRQLMSDPGSKTPESRPLMDKSRASPPV